MAFVYLFLFVASFILGKTESALAEFSWHKIKTDDPLKPSPRFAALTWVDSNSNLWLFGGKNVIKSNETETTQMLNDMWKFSPKTFRWHHIPSRNTSTLPRIDGPLSCSCGDLGFSFGTRENKSLHELWTYNISSNLWHLKELPKNVHDCFVLSCNNNLKTVSLICSNYTSLQMWTFDVKMYQWTSTSIPSTEMVRKLILKTVLKSNMHLIWTTSLKETVYIYKWSFGNSNNSDSVLLTITHTNTTITRVFHHNPGCRTDSMTWIDSASNLHLLGGKKCNSQHVYSDHWILNITDNNWVSVNINKPILSHRSYACLWRVGRSLWVYGGYFQNNKGVTKVLSDIWFGNISKHATPILPDYHLPGDTLRLSMVDKLIISGLVLLVVMAVMVRLCYKRELNQMLLQMKRHRVPYHQLSQEGDKTSRL